MFRREDGSRISAKQVDQAFRNFMNAVIVPQKKVGRNDPCPCGSGKKYKFCCLKKPRSPLDSIENVTERNRCLLTYPYIGEDRKDGQMYLQDYYDMEAIEIDQLLYLGLKNRGGFIWNKDEKQDQIRCRKYLELAFEKFLEKTSADHISTFSEYDEKNSIHYFCADWMGKLLSLLSPYDERYQRVKSCYEKMAQ